MLKHSARADYSGSTVMTKGLHLLSLKNREFTEATEPVTCKPID